MMLKKQIFLISILTVTQTMVQADHNSYHQCNFAIPGYVINRYIDNQNGTVTDSATGLIWLRCNLGMEWNQELQACVGYPQYENWKDSLQSVALYNAEQLAIGANSDWRLPNIKELASLTQLQCVYPSIDTEIFPDSASAYWSSTPAYSEKVDTYDGESTFQEYAAWSINFYVNARETRQGVSQKLAARLVRGPLP